MAIPRLKLKNFDPTPELKKILKRALDSIYDLAPSDSYVRTEVEQTAGGYSVQININSSQNRWSVLKLGAKPAEVVLDAVGSVLNDLTAWKKNRFK